MRSWIARHETAVFLVLTFGLSWPLWVASGTLGRQVIRQPDLRWWLAQIGLGSSISTTAALPVSDNSTNEATR